MTPRAATVLLGLGANLGDPVAQLAEAVVRLEADVQLRGVSSVYRTEPVGHAGQPDFFNLALRGRTRLPPAALLDVLQATEREMGRERPFPNAPRTLDIDLLAYGMVVLDSPGLVVPHPRLHQRAFVLVPLAEVAPEWRHPVLGRTAAELFAALESPGRVERWGELPGR